jgi:hypothetical protein
MNPRITVFSEGRLYRYTLWRQWGETESYAMFIGLNPSTADEVQDDPTIRRCIDFSKQWGFSGLCMTNLFAFRATDPKNMKRCPKPVGDHNDHWLVECARNAGVVVAAWGNHGRFLGRDAEVISIVDRLECFGLTKEKCPMHPLYLPKTSTLIPLGGR